MIRKLQHKFVLFTTCISVAVIVLIVLLINILNYNSILNQTKVPLKILAEKNPHPQNSNYTRDMFPKGIASFFLVYTDDHNYITSIDTSSLNNIDIYEAHEYASSIINSNKTSGIKDNFKYNRMHTNDGFIYIFLDIERELNTHYIFMQLSILVSLSAIIIIFILSCLFSKRAVKPICDSYARQKEFITNVSHEFKTPMAIINADVDVIELEETQNEWRDSIKSQINRLNNLVNKLVSLTKLDEEKTDQIKTDFSLSDALTETVNEFSVLALSSKKQLLTSCNGNISYLGNEASIRNLFNILIENAIKYSIQNTDINLTLKSVGNSTVFTIENYCENLKVGNYNCWFERFYREDKSRNSITNSFGLGLSIAKGICKNHNAKIHAKSTNGKSIIITVVF